MKQLEIGDKVAFTAQFCRSIGAQTGDIPQMRGVIKDIQQIGSNKYARVLWSDQTTGGRQQVPEYSGTITTVHLGNICHIGPNLKFAEC